MLILKLQQNNESNREKLKHKNCITIEVMSVIKAIELAWVHD